MKLSALLTASALGFSIFLHPTMAGDTKTRNQPSTEMGFVKQNDYFPQSKLPMTMDERRLRGELKHFLDRLNRHDPSILKPGPNNDQMLTVGGNTLLGVKIGEHGVLLNFKGSVLAGHEFESFQDFFNFVQEETNAELNRLFKRAPVDVLFVFDGYGIDHYYPLPKKHSGLNAPPPVSNIVVVSAGHGMYHKLNSTGTAYVGWVYQRDPSSFDPNYIEDLGTQFFASSLYTALVNKSGADARLARKLDNVTVDPESGAVWRNMAARYRLAALLPAHPEIWNSDTTGADNEPVLHEENQDIRSRPYYANYLGAAGLISLHSNAAGPAAHGGRVYYDPSVNGSLELADYVWYCLLKAGRAVDPNYTVDEFNGHNKYGELRLSQVTTILVEVAFHTNSGDVALLQNPTFRAAAMAGVEQGWRNFQTVKRVEFCPS